MTFIFPNTNDHSICAGLIGLLIFSSASIIRQPAGNSVRTFLARVFYFRLSSSSPPVLNFAELEASMVIRVAALLPLRSIKGTEKALLFYV